LLKGFVPPQPAKAAPSAGNIEVTEWLRATVRRQLQALLA
jgi:hypothetical protein